MDATDSAIIRSQQQKSPIQSQLRSESCVDCIYFIDGKCTASWGDPHRAPRHEIQEEFCENVETFTHCPQLVNYWAYLKSLGIREDTK